MNSSVLIVYLLYLALPHAQWIYDMYFLYVIMWEKEIRKASAHIQSRTVNYRRNKHWAALNGIQTRALQSSSLALYQLSHQDSSAESYANTHSTN